MGCALAFEACFAAAEEPKPQDTLDLSQLPPELLMMLLSHVPPRVLLGRCRQVCRCWDALVDCPTLWLIILARDHRALWPVLQTCLPPASDARPSILSRFCERRPIGQNLIQNLKGKEAFLDWFVLREEAALVLEENWRVTLNRSVHWQDCFLSAYRWHHKKKVVDLEEEGLWPELLDSGKFEICVSDWWTDKQCTDCLYCLTVQLLDANQGVLHQFAPLPQPDGTHPFLCLQVSHVFSNLKKGVRFVSLEHWIRDMRFLSEQYGVYLCNSSVIVRVRPS
uniref:F-box domain-containing protein n=1 Tax=Sus scrofa TaxID=9823 RepID=A0A8D0SDW4_PIG